MNTRAIRSGVRIVLGLGMLALVLVFVFSLGSSRGRRREREELAAGSAIPAPSSTSKDAGANDSSRSALPRTLPDAIQPLLATLFEKGKSHGDLVSLNVKGVAIGGTLDPERGEISAVFRKRVAPAEAPASGAASHALQCRIINYGKTGWMEIDYSEAESCARYASDPVLAPRCSLRSIWEIAAAAGAPVSQLGEFSLRERGWNIYFYHASFYRDYPDVCIPDEPR